MMTVHRYIEKIKEEKLITSYYYVVAKLVLADGHYFSFSFSFSLRGS